jgi:integrase
MKHCQLTAREVQTLKKPGHYCDGGCLYLQISDYIGKSGAGSKAWVFRYNSPITGRLREMGLGSIDTFTLAEARELARENRKLLARGVDPLEHKRARLAEAKAEHRSNQPFKVAAEAFLALHEVGWRNEKHKRQWRSTLAEYAYPRLGAVPVGAIDAATINETLAPIWLKKQETASRVKQRIERVVEWVRDGMPLPQEPVSKRTTHYEAMPFTQLPDFMVKLRERNGISAKALEFLILTAARTAEVTGAKWSEVDLSTEVWTVPAGRMKGGREHEIPLSKRAVELLKGLPREHGTDYVFVGASTGTGLSSNSMLKLLKGMDANGYTCHGFRSSFRDWSGDRTNFAREVIEHALAHGIKDKAERAYRRETAVEKRRQLMEAWARYLEAPAVEGSNVRPLRRA